MRDHGKEWLLSSQWSITSSVRAPRDLREEVAVEALKPSGVLRLREAANLHHVQSACFHVLQFLAETDQPSHPAEVVAEVRLHLGYIFRATR